MTEERRKRMLTEEDIQAIGVHISSLLPACSLGLTSGDAAIIKGGVGLYKKARNIIGTVVLTVLAVALVGIFTKGFWVSIMEKVKG